MPDLVKPPGRFPDGCPECDGKGGHIARCSHSGMSDPIADRRQRATETFFDDAAYHRRSGLSEDLKEAIDVATQVKITDDIMHDAYAQMGAGPSSWREMRDIIEAAFRAAGFEVVE